MNTVLNLSTDDATYNAAIYDYEMNAAVSLYKYYEATINYNGKKAGQGVMTLLRPVLY